MATTAIVVTLLLTLLVIELILRVSYREEEINGNYWGRGAFITNSDTGYLHAPGYEGYAYRAGALESFVKINAVSLRQSDLKDQLRYPIRILILGDSFAFGLGVAEEQGFVSLIKDKLNRLGVGVVNGAQTGFSSEQERLFGVSLIERFAPKMVILAVYAGNDVYGDNHKGYRHTEVRYGYRLSKHRWFAFWPFDFLRTHSYLWLLIDGKLNQARNVQRRAIFNATANSHPEDALQPTLEAIGGLHEFCLGRAIIFGVMMIPDKGGETPFDDPLRSYFRERGIPLLDLVAAEHREGDFLPKDGHWNPSGHERAARYLVPFIQGLLVERTP